MSLNPSSKLQSRIPLMIGLVISGVLFSGLVGFGLYNLYDATKVQKLKEDSRQAYDGPIETRDKPKEFNAYSQPDYGEVCAGRTVTNNAGSTDKKSAIIAAFFSTGEPGDTFSMLYPGFGKSYYLKSSTDPKEVGIVACFSGNRTELAIDCTYDSKQIKYYGATYSAKFIDPRIGTVLDESTADEPADRCPTFVSYSSSEKIAVANMRTDTAEQLIDAFIGK